MSKITVFRAYFPDCTLGRLYVNGITAYCATLELPWLQNATSKSCIPEGIYNYRVAMSPSRKKLVIWIDNVPNRTAIQIHEGNFTRQIEGCVAVGLGIKDINKDGVPDVTESVSAFSALISSIKSTGTIEFKTAVKL